MAAFRKIVFKILGGGTIMTIIIMWLALPLYWGSRESPSFCLCSLRLFS